MNVCCSLNPCRARGVMETEGQLLRIRLMQTQSVSVSNTLNLHVVWYPITGGLLPPPMTRCVESGAQDVDDCGVWTSRHRILFHLLNSWSRYRKTRYHSLRDDVDL